MKLESVADRQLHPATFLTRAIRQLPQYALGLPAAFGVISETGFGTVLLVALGGIGIALLGAWLYWTRFRYGLGADEIVIESGILHRQRRVIPFDRIQDIDIEQGLLARLFGTAKVRIETGGSAKDEGDLDSVALAEAHRLRELLRSQAAPAARHGPWGAAAEPAEEAEPLLFRMDLKRVLLAGLFNFSLVFFAILFGALEYLQPITGIDPLEMDWIDPAQELAAQATWTMTLAGVLFVLMLGVVAGVLRTLAQDYGFRLTRTAAGLRRRRGLLTLSEAVIPLRRIQASVIRSGAVARLFGWHRLEFQTLSADSAKSGNQMAVPFGRMGEISPVLKEAHKPPLPPDSAYVRVSVRHILTQSLKWVGLMALPVLGFSFAFPAAAALFLLLPVVIGAAALQWRHHRYCLTDDALHIRGGLLSRTLWVLPYERIQTIGVDRGPLQRLLGLATLVPDSAGASLLGSAQIANLPADRAVDLSEELLDRHKKAREGLKHLSSGRVG